MKRNSNRFNYPMKSPGHRNGGARFCKGGRLTKIPSDSEAAVRFPASVSWGAVGKRISASVGNISSS
jgi:hypothetical protein